MHDIYDPPPVPKVDLDPPRSERLVFTRNDLACLAALCGGLLLVAVIAWRNEPGLALISAGKGLGGTWRGPEPGHAFRDDGVELEPGKLVGGPRCPPVSLKLRWTIFLAALVPWIVGLGLAVSLMLCLFWISDHLG